MRAIDKFILHVTHNLFSLNEYSEKEINYLMAQFKDEADDLNIQITDAQLKAYIERFDSLKNSPKVTEKDLRKYSLSKLINLVTSSKGVVEPEDTIDTTPDIVYNENGLIIYNGSKENNCLTFGAGEKWCITRGSFGNYRYDDNRKNPTFYLVKDTNLPDSDRKSFFVVVVGKDDTYKASDRSNNDVGGRGTEWERWEPFSFVESNFPSIRGLRNIFKYIPLSSSEKLNQSYATNPVTIREWSNFPYTVKEQYLVVRKGKTLFKDITNELFLEKYLLKYPQIATFISTNAGIIGSTTLVSYLDKFSNQDVKSIIANMRDTINLKYLSTDIPFDVKKLLVKFNKWDLSNDERLYVIKDGSAIVKLTLGDDIKISLYQADDDFPNVKLNKRTSRFLLDYTELDKIPFKSLVKLVSDEIIDKRVIDNVIEKAKTDPNSAMVIKKVDGVDILLDSNSFASYKIEGDKIAQIPFDSEEVQKIFTEMEDNKGFQESAINLLSEPKDISTSVDKDALLSIVNATPYSGRMKNIGGDPAVLLTSSEGDNNFFWASEDPNQTNRYSYRPIEAFGRNGDWRIFNAYASSTVPYFQSYFDYLRSEGKSLTEETLLNILKSSTSFNIKKEVVRLDPPIASTSRYVPKIYNDIAYLVNRTNPRESLRLSDTGKLVKANLTSYTASIILGGALPATQATTAVGRRGRPAGQPNAPRVAQPAAADEPAANEFINVSDTMEEIGLDVAFLRLPRADLRYLSGAGQVGTGIPGAYRVNPNGDRGAARRNNQLGAAGRVGRIIAVGSSKIYIIRLANQQVIASINIQPGNRNYILLGNANGNTMIPINSPSELMSVLQNRNLAEVHSYIVREYVTQHPRHLDEVRSMIQQHINETKNI
jgi:hypothetical protein